MISTTSSVLNLTFKKGTSFTEKKNNQKEDSFRTVASHIEAENCSYSYTHLVRVTNFNCCHKFNSILDEQRSQIHR